MDGSFGAGVGDSGVKGQMLEAITEESFLEASVSMEERFFL